MALTFLADLLGGFGDVPEVSKLFGVSPAFLNKQKNKRFLFKLDGWEN